MKMNVTTPRTQYDGLRMSTTKFVLLFAIFLDFFLQFKQNTVSVSISAFVQIITSKAYVLVRNYMNDRSTDPVMVMKYDRHTHMRNSKTTTSEEISSPPTPNINDRTSRSSSFFCLKQTRQQRERTNKSRRHNRSQRTSFC